MIEAALAACGVAWLLSLPLRKGRLSENTLDNDVVQFNENSFNTLLYSVASLQLL